MYRSHLSFLLGIVFFIAGFGLAYFLIEPEAPEPGREFTASNEDTVPADAASLYARHCALCHGEHGHGDGWAAPWLLPPARNFARGEFLITRTDNGVPTDQDLLRTLGHGMPGSAMPSWAWLGEEQRLDLVALVRRMAIDGYAAMLRGSLGDDRVGAREAASLAIQKLTPGQVIAPPPRPEVSDEVLARGKAAYLEACVLCHGPDGRGDRRDHGIDPETGGHLMGCRDLTTGILKGGASFEDLYWRVQSGMKASGMHPKAMASEEDSVAIIVYLQTLFPDEMEGRHRLGRGSLRVSRVDHIPDDPGESLWRGASALDVVVTPLWWSDQAVLTLRLLAVHDGETIAIMARWPDDTCDDQMLDPEVIPDAIALQFDASIDPPMMGMGDRENPSSIWHWRAFRREALVGLFDLLEDRPHGSQEGEELLGRESGAPDYAPAIPRAALLGEPSREAMAKEAHGPEDVLNLKDGVRAIPKWEEGAWSVVFIHPMKDHPILKPGVSFSLSCAVWNGSARQKGPVKSISIWQEMIVE